jgi:membrane-bound ClpP family serine protease
MPFYAFMDFLGYRFHDSTLGIAALFSFGCVCLVAFVALIFGAVGLIKPNPSFKRALVVLLLPLLTPLLILNLIVFIIVWYKLIRPTKSEKRTAKELGKPLPPH